MVPHVRGELRVALEVRREHLGVHGVGLRRGAVLVLVLVVICAAVEVGGALVLVGAAVLFSVSVWDFVVRSEGETHIGIATQDGAHFARRVFKELLVVAENNDGNIYRAEHGKLMSLLEETAFAFQKGAVDGGL